MSAPTGPTAMSPSTPKPLPPTTSPASQPAMMPMIIQPINAVRIAFPFLLATTGDAPDPEDRAAVSQASAETVPSGRSGPPGCRHRPQRPTLPIDTGRATAREAAARVRAAPNRPRCTRLLRFR
jgi:hypothetical protein